MNTESSDDDWQENWDARLAVLEQELGKAEEDVATSPVPIYLGGGADVLTFKKHLHGVVYVTAGLIGDGGQKPTELGEYELMMCLRSEDDWAPSLLSQLAPYTFDAALNPGETMDIAPAMPEGSTITALFFASYRQFTVNEIKSGLLLCIGLTNSEVAACRDIGPDKVLAKLKDNGVFPFTDPHRKSTFP